MYQKNIIKIGQNNPVDRDSSIALIHYNQSYYCDFENKEGLLKFLGDIEGRCVFIGIMTSDNLMEGLDFILDSSSYKREKIGKRTSYIEMNLKKADFVQNKALINFILTIAEINDFVFIVVDPPAKTKLVDVKTRKLIINTKITPLYAVFNYDAESLIVFE